MQNKNTKKGYPVEAVANFFIHAAMAEHKSVSHLKLQKIICIAHGWCLALLGKPLIDEDIQAWRYGPVIKSLYHALKSYGQDPIDSRVTLPALEGDKVVDMAPDMDEADEDVLGLLKKVWNAYGNATPAQLVAVTHEKGTPWTFYYNRNDIGGSIPDEAIKTHYEKLSAGREARY